MNCDNTSLTR